MAKLKSVKRLILYPYDCPLGFDRLESWRDDREHVFNALARSPQLPTLFIIDTQCSSPQAVAKKERDYRALFTYLRKRAQSPAKRRGSRTAGFYCRRQDCNTNEGPDVRVE